MLHPFVFADGHDRAGVHTARHHFASVRCRRHTRVFPPQPCRLPPVQPAGHHPIRLGQHPFRGTGFVLVCSSESRRHGLAHPLHAGNSLPFHGLSHHVASTLTLCHLGHTARNHCTPCQGRRHMELTALQCCPCGESLRRCAANHH